MNRALLEQDIVDTKNKIWELEKVLMGDISSDMVMSLRLELLQLGYKLEEKEMKLRIVNNMLLN